MDQNPHLNGNMLTMIPDYSSSGTQLDVDTDWVLEMLLLHK
jgi:hypothetical protein